jgi:hypothetical protein
MSAKIFPVPLSAAAMRRVKAAGVDLTDQALAPERYHEVIVLPVIRREVYAVPTVAEQAAAVSELLGAMRDIVVPKLPGLTAADRELFLARLEAAAATLEKLSRSAP